jgi:hypothetical protein
MLLRSRLTEYGQALPTTASVRALVTAPDGSTSTLALSQVGDATYELGVPAMLPGIYHFLVSANGSTSRGTPFTRQQVLTGAVWRGGDRPPPTSDDHPGSHPTRDALCDVLRCVTEAVDPRLRERLAHEGLSIDKLRDCACD